MRSESGVRDAEAAGAYCVPINNSRVVYQYHSRKDYTEFHGSKFNHECGMKLWHDGACH